MRPRFVLAVAIAAVLATAAVSVLAGVPAARAALGNRASQVHPAPQPSPSPMPHAVVAMQAAPPPPTLHAAAVTTPPGTLFFGWALLDRKTGAVSGSANAASGQNTTESMVKAWIASDFLRRQAESGQTPSAATLQELTLMIIDSNDDMAQKYYELGGGDADIQRLIKMCGLTHTQVKSGWWAETQMTPQDAVRYGNCVASGTAAGPRWTGWILDTMKHVRGGVADQASVERQGGHWGIIDGLPADLVPQTSIKNGWTWYGDSWHVNCLAINPAWILTVMTRYPVNNLQTGANVCAGVARQLTYYPPI